MQFLRIFKHLFFLDFQIRKAFPPATLQSIERAIQASEQSHAGEIRFAVEASLDGLPLFLGHSAKQRALEVFSQLRVWDTEHNNGVLIYVLLADRAVEIVADRGIQLKAGNKTWEDICHTMEIAFARSEFLEGSAQGIACIQATLSRYFPGLGQRANELPDAPVLLN